MNPERFLGEFSFYLPSAGLGVVGAAIATAISYGGRNFHDDRVLSKSMLSPRSQKLSFQKNLAGKCLHIGIPIALERISACLGQVVFTSLVTRLGTLALATHSIAITAEQAFYIPGYGMQAAAANDISAFSGRRRSEKIKTCDRYYCDDCGHFNDRIRSSFIFLSWFYDVTRMKYSGYRRRSYRFKDCSYFRTVICGFDHSGRDF